MYDKIIELAKQYYPQTIIDRRDFHKFPERGWLEIRTASLIARRLNNLGYTVLTGKDVMNEEARMGVPHQKILDLNYQRALLQGGDKEYVEKVKNGFTAVVGILHCGKGPTVGIRFDIDALGVHEDTTSFHRPTMEHFNSCNKNAMHACGHDGHIAIGLSVAKIIMDIKASLHGTVKLIFQPAEEGVRGAKSIVESGILDDIDYLYAGHIFPRTKEEQEYDLCLGMNETFATTKLDVYYHGISSHAAGMPQFGKNAILSAASCILNLHSIPRNSDGCTRVNVGTVTAGTGRNVVAETAKLEIEVRGATTELNRYMEVYARDIIEGAAIMHDTVVEVKEMGKAYSLECDNEFMNVIDSICLKHLPFLHVSPISLSPLNGSDDFSYMMHQVQMHGGKATYMKLLTDTPAALHNDSYDIDERVLLNGTTVFSVLTYNLLSKKDS